MKHHGGTLFLLSLAALLLASSCATIKQNVDARALLAKCRYEYAGIDATGVKFANGIEIASVDFDVKVKVTNTVDRDVAIDHAEFAFYLDSNRILDLGHERFVRIAPSNSSVEPIAVSLPFADIAKTLGHRPEKIGVKAKLWVTILVGKDSWETPAVIPVEVEMAIPYDQINAFVERQKAKLKQEADAEAARAAKAAQDAAEEAAKRAAEAAAEAARKATDAAAEAAKKAADAAVQSLPKF